MIDTLKNSESNLYMSILHLQVHKVLMHSNQRPSGMLHRHLNRIVEKYPCRDCNLSFKNCDEFTSHLRSVHNDFRFVCHICAKMFKLKGSLLVHQRVVHQSAEGEGHHCKGAFYIKLRNAAYRGSSTNDVRGGGWRVLWWWHEYQYQINCHRNPTEKTTGLLF